MLILERVHCFPIQSIGIAVDYLDVATISFVSFELSQVGPL